MWECSRFERINLQTASLTSELLKPHMESSPNLDNFKPKYLICFLRYEVNKSWWKLIIYFVKNFGLSDNAEKTVPNNLQKIVPLSFI
jgi:hypothetical protein